IAAMLGAEEFGIGTASLIAMGCIMVRQCHSNTCPVGVCTQDEALRAKFTGSPEKVINLFTFIAEEVREILGTLGVRSIEEIVGRTDLLMQVSRGGEHLDDLDLNPLLVKADPGLNKPYCTVAGRNEVPDTLDAQIVRDAAPLLERGEKMQLTYTVANTARAIGTRTSSHIVRKFGMTGLAPGHLTVQLKGSAGQSLGAFAVQGLRIELTGEANDYVGKGLSGATIAIRPSPHLLRPEASAILGNTVLYGATAGRLFAAGLAGERFGVRNSGAVTVVEGIGANGLEYMTGGMAFVYDPQERFRLSVNPESVVVCRVASEHWAGVLKDLIAEHVRETGSRYAEDLLRKFDSERGRFWQVCPKEMVGRLDHVLEAEERVHERA
ncbi:MAG: gltB, partial [Caulobacteraceae bacterium]|nr:gltB [Caulobacteraceae bacterium]